MLKVIKVTIISAFSVGFATMAMADQVSYSHTTQPNPVPYQNEFALANFDTSLGTLTAVDITFSYRSSMSFSAYNPTGSTQSFGVAGGGFTFGVSAPDSISTGANETFNTSGSVASGQTGLYYSPVSTGLISASVPMSDFAAYETPPSGAIGFYTVVGEGLSLNVPNNSPLEFEIQGATLSGTTTVTYTYTPLATPEPASFAALGLGAVGLIRRKRRK